LSPPGCERREEVVTTPHGAARPLEREDSGARVLRGGQESSAGLADWSTHGAADAIAAPAPKAAAKTTSPHGVPDELREFFDFGDDDDETARSYPGVSGSGSEADSEESEVEEDWFHMERRRTSSSGSRRPSLELPRL
jgi:hypothetical protein